MADQRCAACGYQFRVLEDEAGLHECPSCGFSGRQERERAGDHANIDDRDDARAAGHRGPGRGGLDPTGEGSTVTAVMIPDVVPGVAPAGVRPELGTEASGALAPKSPIGLRPPWRPGESGNPNGRPKGERAYLQRLYGKDGRKLIERFEQLYADPKTPTRVRVEILKFLVERMFGRAPQVVGVEGGPSLLSMLTEMHATMQQESR